MDHECLIVMIDGVEIADVYPDLIGLEVELDDELAALFRLHVALSRQPDGTWTYLDDERFMIWKPVTIRAGFGGDVDDLIAGYITHVKPHWDPDPARCTVEIWGMDGSVVMDQAEKLKAWPNKKDSDIAAELFGAYGFSPDVEDSAVVHDESVSTIIQRETDMQFLKRLALRNGFDCYVDGETGYFRTAQLAGPPQPVLAVHFGDETNVRQFSIEVNALALVDVTMLQLDRSTKEVLDVAAETSEQPLLGRTDAAGLRAAGVDPGLVVVNQIAATGLPEMTVLCQALYQEGTWFVTGEGEILATAYGHVLRPRRTVTITGLGETYSGEYYVNHVTHSFTCDGYVQVFGVKRNALTLTGAEAFSSAGGR